jgi:hypothetical protein
MTLISRQYFDEIIGTLREAGEKVVHVFLGGPRARVRHRVTHRAGTPGNWPGRPAADTGG